MIDRILKLERLVKWIYCKVKNGGTGGGIQSVQEGDNITIDNTDPLNPIISSTGGGEEPLTEEFVVTAPAGSYGSGDIFPEGMTLSQAFIALLTDTFYPTFTNPTFSMNTNAGLREAGEVFTLDVSGTFNRGIIRGALVSGVWNPNTTQGPRAGLPTSYVIDGTTYTTTNLNQSKITTGYTIPLGSATFNGSVNYSAGPQPLDSQNANYMAPLPAGTLSSTTTVTGYLRRYAGPLSTIPTTGAQVRTALLGTSVLNTANSFTFTTGTVERIFAIAIPSTKNLVNVTNAGTNENLTSGFVLTGITTVPDAGGTNRSYKVYVMENAVPFSNNYTINVTLS